jgi:hypothetical protein
MNGQSYSPDSMNFNLKHHDNITIWHNMQYSPVYWCEAKWEKEEQNTYIQLQH